MMCFSDHLYSLLQIFSYINFNISIHAPAKGATFITLAWRGAAQNFNPRSREGSDEDQTAAYTVEIWFQSTLPRRERPIRHTDKPFHTGISIHAPAKGATGKNFDMSKRVEFQSTLPRRERRDRRYWKKMEQKISIHAPAKGATFLR